MAIEFTDADLEAYLDEALDSDYANQLEQALRDDQALLARLSHINGRRDAGIHTLGEIWRRNQVGVPSSEEMQNFVLGTLSDAHADYIQFRIDTLKCRYTIAMLHDLKSQANADEQSKTSVRRKKYFDSSAGLLSPGNDD